MEDDYTMIGKKVKTIQHKNLCDNYFNLEGIIINHKEEIEIKRSSKHNNEPMPTNKVFNLYLVEFNQILDKRMSNKLWLYEDMFQIIE
jgi:hypothetical protein